MSPTRSRLGTVVLAALVLFIGSALGAYAANGGPLRLGASNSASKTTSLKNTGAGPALKLKSKAGNPSLKVSSKKKVKRLNADRVDNLEAAALQNQSFVYSLVGTSAGTTIRFPLADLPSGKYLATYQVSATVGGAPNYFGCAFDTGAPFSNSTVSNLGNRAGTTWFVSAAGYLDASSQTYGISCNSDAAGISVLPGAQVTLTRVDNVTSKAATGARAEAKQSPFGG